MVYEFYYSYVDGQVIFEPRPELSVEINEAAKKLLSAVIVMDGVCYTSSVGPISTIYDGLVKIILKTTV